MAADPQAIAAAIHMLRSGRTASHVSSVVGYSERSVRRWAKRAGVKLRMGRPPRTGPPTHTAAVSGCTGTGEDGEYASGTAGQHCQYRWYGELEPSCTATTAVLEGVGR